MKYKDKHKIINNIEYKLCSCCNKWFVMNSEYFKIHPSQKDGFSDRCNVCQQNYSHNRYIKNREKEIDKAKQWAKDNKDRHNAININAYHTNRWGYKNSVREAQHKRRENGKYYSWLNNTESGLKSKIKTSKLQQEKKHKIYDIEWFNCKKYFSFTCAYCGLPIDKHYTTYRKKVIIGDFHKDHVVHLGKNDLSNCIPSCEKCNCEKHDKTINEWYNKNNQNYTYERYHKIYLWLRYDYKKYILPKRRYKGQHMNDRIKEIDNIKMEKYYRTFILFGG